MPDAIPGKDTGATLVPGTLDVDTLRALIQRYAAMFVEELRDLHQHLGGNL